MDSIQYNTRRRKREEVAQIKHSHQGGVDLSPPKSTTWDGILTPSPSQDAYTIQEDTMI